MILEHPRWGASQGLQTTKDIKAGEQLLAYYHYTQHERGQYYLDVPWYWEQKRQIEKDERLARRNSEKCTLNHKSDKERECVLDNL